MWNGINKRKFPRANYPCRIAVKRKDHPDSLSTQTENIGIGGICLILPRDLGIFAPVEVKLDLMDRYPVIECDGTIVWVVARTQEKNKMFDTGIEFTTIGEDDTARIGSIVEKILKETIED